MVAVWATQEGGAQWRRMIVPVYIDNRAFQLSAAKGWSKAGRLNDLLRYLFECSVKWECIFMFYWISTHDNVIADALSRREGHFEVPTHPRLGEFVPPGTPLTAHPACGCIRHWGKGFSCSTDGDGPASQARLPSSMSVQYPRASIYSHLPADIADEVDELIDNRLGPSSHSSIRAALGHWDVARAGPGWARIVSTDDEARGSKLAAFVVYLVRKTTLGYSSISNYVWALRTWMKFQRQLDPILGVAEWDDFMGGVEVRTFVPGEPRKEVPGAWVQGAAMVADTDSFQDCRAMCVMLMLLYTFSRSETPLPQSHTGDNAMDPAKHLQKKDVQVATVGGKLSVGWRLKAIKQDPRMQRDSAQGEGDWVWVGEAAGKMSLLFWIQCYFRFFKGSRDGDEPFFVRGVGGKSLL